MILIPFVGIITQRTVSKKQKRRKLELERRETWTDRL